jgi:hypothetical protein
MPIFMMVLSTFEERVASGKGAGVEDNSSKLWLLLSFLRRIFVYHVVSVSKEGKIKKLPRWIVLTMGLEIDELGCIFEVVDGLYALVQRAHLTVGSDMHLF